MNMQNLYVVSLRGAIAGPYYVVAETVDAAVNTIIEEFNHFNHGTPADRVMDTVKLIGQEGGLNPTITRLFHAPGVPSHPPFSLSDLLPPDGYGDGK